VRRPAAIPGTASWPSTQLANVQHFDSFLSPEAFREKIVQERKTYGDVIRKANIKV
jgi:hypothetical protein